MSEIALKILWADLGKAIAMILGVAFSTLLMAQQAAIFVCLMANSASHINGAQDVDIWVADPRADYFDDPGFLPAGLIDQVKSAPGVAYAAPFIRSSATADSNELVEQSILVGVDENSFLGAPGTMSLGELSALRASDTFVVDRRGYGDIWPEEELRLGRLLEVDGRVLKLVGIADPPSPFISMPLLYVSATTASLVKGGIAPSFIVVRLKDGWDAKAVAQTITERTGYGAFDKASFARMTVDYYLNNTGIPINFFITITLGFIVGAAIVVQTFYLFISENLKHLAVFKAIGAKNAQIISMTAMQCLVVALIGFSLGSAAAAWFFESVPGKVPAFKGFFLPWGVIAKVGAAVIAIAFLSGLFSISRALRLPPAQVLRG